MTDLLEDLDQPPTLKSRIEETEQLHLPVDPSLEVLESAIETTSSSHREAGENGEEGSPKRADDTGEAGSEGVVLPQLMVKVLGRPGVPARPSLRRRELALVVFLACKGQPTPAASVQHAVWGGRAVSAKTVWNLATATRSALGQLGDGTPAMPASERAHHTLALAPGVRTDLQLFDQLYGRAQDASSVEAIELLRQALDLIEGQPFDGADFEWAHHTELLVAQATRLIETAAEQLVELATDAGRIDLARHAITQGLRALPGNEVLYRARMTLEHQEGNAAGIRAAYDELASFLMDIETDPSRATMDLYRRLLPQPGRHAS